MSLELLQQLIKIPSYSGQEQKIQQFIKDHFEENGMETFFQNENLVVYLKGKDPTRAFIFNSHTDVVDVGDESKWKHGPWSGDIEGGRIYGRGASDMKGGVYASIETAKSLFKEGQPPTDIWFTYVVREETDGSGTKSFAKWFKEHGYPKQYKEIAAIFTEPTNLTTVEYGNRGNFFIKAAIDGDAGHSSRPHQIKTHAIMQMVKFINDLEQESTQWKEQFKGSEFTPPTITPTAIEAKSQSPNKTSDHCEAVFDLRTIPDFHQEAFEKVSQLANQRGITLSLVYPDAPAGYTKPDAKIVKVIKSIIPNIKLGIFEAAADLGFLTNSGVQGVIFGPGESEQAHRIDESVSTDQVFKTSKIYEEIYIKWVNFKEKK